MDQKSSTVSIRLRPEDVALMDKAAQEDDRTRSSWLRRLILNAIDQERNVSSPSVSRRARA